MPRTWAAPALVELTAANDGLSHRVFQAVYDRCVVEGRGRYLTLCRRTVLATAMVTEPGPMCPACRQVVRHQPQRSS